MSLASAIQDSTLSYPGSEDGYSPSEAYPEYQHGTTAVRPNTVYAAVRRVLQQGGLDAERFGTASWNPLAGLIAHGSHVFVLCNFVQHRRANESTADFQAKCVHGSVLRALLDYVLLAVGDGGKVVFGNAALQSCDWGRVLADTGAERVLEFYRRMGVANVEARDLRLYVAPRDAAGRVQKVERDQQSGGVPVDLGPASLLAGINSGDGTLFRVSDYDPQRTLVHHQHGRHVYIISPEVLDADVVLSLPKLKTHEKVGVTCALKGFVGAIAHKDCLAHHRLGPPAEGGDEYPSPSWVRSAISRLHDRVNQRPAEGTFLRLCERIARRLIRMMGGIQFGSWHGNDTAWRMALDIARILKYAARDGSMQATAQRAHLMLVDGIVGGEGNGPLAPRSVHSGVLLFSDDVALGDWAAASLMGFDPRNIPLIDRAFAPPQAISEVQPAEQIILINGEATRLADGCLPCPHPFGAPRGWVGHLEHRTRAQT